MIILMALLACQGNPSDRLTWRESWQIVGLDADGTFIDGSVTVGNTGLLRGQGHLRVSLYPRTESPVLLHGGAGPNEVLIEKEEVRLGSDSLSLEEKTWTLAVREGQEALDATIRLTRPVGEVGPVTLQGGERQWLLGLPVPFGTLTGVWRAGEQVGLIDGVGCGIRQAGDAWPSDDRRSLYIFTRSEMIGVELKGDEALAWMSDEDGVQVGHTAVITEGDRTLSVSLLPDLPFEAEISLNQHITVAPQEHLTALEAIASEAAFGEPEVKLWRGWADWSEGRGRAFYKTR